MSQDGLRRVVLLDTSVASTNLGDQIIMQAVRKELAGVLSDALVFSVASHDTMGAKGRGLVRQADLTLSGGTNLLSSRMWMRSVWRLTPLDALANLNVTLMGAGWYQFQNAPDPYTRWLLKSVLGKRFMHSVRDGHTLGMLASIGITNVINTGCPTLWGLDAAACARVPREKGESVVTTINTYIPDREADRRMIEILRSRYKTIYAWVQTAGDHAYLRSLGEDIVILDPSLAAYDALLASDQSLDYVGNRLHGGIRALQHGRRTVIVEIDNRAKEIGRDFKLPTLERDDFAGLEKMIDEPFAVSIALPTEAIDRWRDQFKPGAV